MTHGGVAAIFSSMFGGFDRLGSATPAGAIPPQLAGETGPREATGAFRGLRGTSSDGIDVGSSSQLSAIEAQVQQLMQMLQELIANSDRGARSEPNSDGGRSLSPSQDGPRECDGAGAPTAIGGSSAPTPVSGMTHHRLPGDGRAHRPAAVHSVSHPASTHETASVGAPASGGEAGALAAMKKLVAERPPYVWGDTGRVGYDCSGLCGAAYYAAGFDMPRTAALQYQTGPHVSRADLKPGDLVFWGSSASSIHHVAMYAGDGMIYSADHTGDYARLQPMWTGDYFGATRPTKADAAAEVARTGSRWEPGN